MELNPELNVALAAAMTLFVAAWCVAVGGWIVGVVEAIAVWRLVRWPFRIGLVAMSSTKDGPCPTGLAAESMNETALTKYRVLPGRVCLFRRRYALFAFRWNTPLEVKGTISWADGKLLTVGRYPLGVTLFFLGWLAGWSIGGVAFLTQKPLVGAPFLALGWAVGGGMMLHSRILERRRFLRHASEVVDALQRGPRVA